jgi:hypothetical protein
MGNIGFKNNNDNIIVICNVENIKCT